MAELAPEAILHERGALIAVDKPPGVVCHATVDPTRDHVVAMLGRLLARRTATGSGAGAGAGSGASEPPPVHPVHRLDRDTSGVLLCATDPAVAARLSAIWGTAAVRKTYLAIQGGDVDRLPDAGEIRDHLAQGKGRDRERVVVVRSGGKRAVSHFRVLGRAGGLALVAWRIDTGRRHQIRVHAASLGCPIVADEVYGGTRSAGATRCMLHAWRLELPATLANDPAAGDGTTTDDTTTDGDQQPTLAGVSSGATTDATLTIVAPLPADMKAVLDRAGLHSDTSARP